MAWVVERHGAKGTRYRGGYRDPDGRLRSAGTSRDYVEGEWLPNKQPLQPDGPSAIRSTTTVEANGYLDMIVPSCA